MKRLRPPGRRGGRPVTPEPAEGGEQEAIASGRPVPLPDRLSAVLARLTRLGTPPRRSVPAPGGARPRGVGSATSRTSVAFVLIGVLLAAILYDQVERPPEPVAAQPDRTIITPSVTDPSPLDGAWYCPLGSSSPEGAFDHTVHISNLSDGPAVANLTVLTDAGRGLTQRIELAPLSTNDVTLSSLVQANVAGAVVEIIGGDGVVGHTVRTAHGPAEGTCSTHVSNSWYFASGRTSRDAKYYLALMNPFPEDVRFNVEFYRPTGNPRKPAALTGQEVPANSVRIIDVDQIVPRDEALAASVVTERGRLVVERLQVLDGALGPAGAALQLGVTTPAQSWMLPAGRIHEGGEDRVMVFNPSLEQSATVEVELWPLNPSDRSLYGLGPIPRELLPGRFEVIDLRAEAERYGLRLPYEVGVSVRALTDTPIVVERWHLGTRIDTSLIGAGGDQISSEAPPAEGETAPPAEGETATPPEGGGGELDLPGIFGDETATLSQATANTGLSTSRGAEVLSTRWVVPYVSTPTPQSSVVIVTSPEETNVEVLALVNGELQGPFRATVPASGRAVIPLPVVATGGPLLVTALAPVSVEAQVVVPDVNLAVVPGVPTVTP